MTRLDASILTEYATGVLEDAGWSSSREVDNEATYQSMKARGLHLTQPGIKLCNELGGLIARYYHDSKSYELFHFDLNQTLENLDQEWLHIYEKRCGELLMPIGQSRQRHMLLMIDQIGSIWAGFDDHFERLATTPEEAINRLVQYKWEPSR